MSSGRSRLPAVAAALALALGLSLAAQAQTLHFELPSQPAASGVRAFAKQAGLSIILASAAAKGRSTNAVKGELEAHAALGRLLAGTGLRVCSWDGDTVVIDVSPDETDSTTQVVVTGSHIARPELQSAMPVSIISMETARSYGRHTAYDALLLDPAIGPGLGELNSGGQEYDQGVANINLRNMGANRSLVLVDGQRWVSSGARTSAVDLNTIPSALIDHYEVVTGGAAAIYGADAVTGAVNVIMKKDFSGAQISATSGLSGQGDANQHNVSAVGGFRFAGGRGSFEAGADYTYTRPVYDTDRFDERYINEPNPADTGPHDGIPDNILINYRQFYRSDYPTFCLYQGRAPCGTHAGQWYQLLNGAVVPIPQGTYSVVTNGETGVQNGGPPTTSNVYEGVLLRAMSQKASVYAHASYQLTADTAWSVSAGFAQSHARNNPEWPQVRDDARSPENWWTVNGVPNTGEIATLTNPYLPESLRSFMVANGLTQIPLDRTYMNLPQAFEHDNRNNITVGTDVSGRLGGRLAWAAFARYGQVINHITTTNMVGASEWLNARDGVVDPATGQIECAAAAARAAGCAPFDFFSTEAPGQAWLDYAERSRHERTRNSQLTTGTGVNGSLLSLPAGDLTGAAGLEWRREELHTRDDPDVDKLLDIVFGPGEDYALHPALDALRDTAEAYGELVIPLLTDLPAARRLTIEGAYRWSHYSDNPATGTWKSGGTWEPVTGVTFRGTFSRSTRVPNFGELYSPPGTTTYGHIDDPCMAGLISQNPSRAANCAATVPGWAGPLPNPNLNQPVVYSGGNPDLTPETSTSYTVGAVLQPAILQGFDLTVDYWNIRIDNIVTQLAYTALLADCVDFADGPNEGYCQYVHRNPDGTVNHVQAQYANLAGQIARGIDISASYHVPIGGGMFRATLSGTRRLEQTIIAEKGKPGIDYAGAWDFPAFKSTLITEYSIGRLALGISTRFISRSKLSATAASAETYQFPVIPAYVYNDVTIDYRATDRVSVGVGVKNIGDVGMPNELENNAISPHLTGGSVTGAGGAAYYDAIGRYFFVKADVKLF